MRISFREYVFPFGDNSVWLLKQFFVLSIFFSSSLLKIIYMFNFICTNYFSAGFIFHLFQVIYIAVFLCRNGYAGSSRMKMYFDPFQPTVQFHAQFQMRKLAQLFCYATILLLPTGSLILLRCMQFLNLVILLTWTFTWSII